MKRKTILILLPCWKRSDILQLVADHLELFIKKNTPKYKFKVLWVISPEDPQYIKIDRIYNHFNAVKHLVYASNKPLGNKMNIGIEAALNIGFDYLMNLGTDDLIHPDLMKIYEDYINKGIDIFGLNKVYFYDLKSDKCFLFSYKNNDIIGAGRMISYKAIEDTVSKYGTLYEKLKKRSLDSSSAKMLNKAGYNFNVIDPGYKVYITDIKCDENINSFNFVHNSRNNNLIIDSNPLTVKNRFQLLTNFLKQTK